MKRILKLTFYTLLLFSFSSLSAQNDNEASLTLDLKKARADYEVTKQQFENDTKLFENKAISINDYNRSKNALLSKEVDYQKLILKLISQQSYLTVEQAVKYQTSTGSRRVRIAVKSAREGNEEYLKQFEEHFDIFTPEMRSGKIYNIYVSLIDCETQTIIGTPYEYRIPAIDLGKQATADFELLRDVESLIVSLNYNGKKEEKNIYLQKDASSSVIDINSIQFSQEADLNSTATYELDLERFSTFDDTYKLAVLNLPPQITYDFQDGESRVTQIRFSQGVNTKKLSLRVYLPDRESEDVHIDQPISFHVAVLNNEQYEKLQASDDATGSLSFLKANASGYETLELVPRGRGRIEVRVSNLYFETTEGEHLPIEATIRNSGTRRLDNIKVTCATPANWQTVIEPELISTLEPGKEQKITITVIPDSDGNIGAQEVKIQAAAVADNRRVNSEDKSVRIQIKAQTSIGVIIIMALLVIGLVSGAILWGVKLSRK